MTSMVDGTSLREVNLGRYVTGQTSTITADATYQVFTVAGGEVLITALWGKVTTAITDAGEDIALQMDPTTGTTVQLTQNSGDIGTGGVAAGDLITFSEDNDGASAPGILTGVTAAKGSGPLRFVATTGEIELVVGAGTGSEDGVIAWYCTYVPLTVGATVAAATT